MISVQGRIVQPKRPPENRCRRPERRRSLARPERPCQLWFMPPRPRIRVPNGLSRHLLGVAILTACSSTACGGGGEATVTERLWISAVPTQPTARTSAFLATRTSDAEYIGAFFQGSMYRGGHDVFRWEDTGKDTATLTFLQDDEKVELRFETCKPTTGFDHCIIVHGDPTGARTYQSRKRWRVRRPGKKKGESVAMLMSTLAELAHDDEELQAVLAE